MCWVPGLHTNCGCPEIITDQLCLFMTALHFMVCGVPGLLEGAHEGRGLGHEFLRHCSRARMLVHVLDGNSPDPLGDFHAIQTELQLFQQDLSGKPQVSFYVTPSRGQQFALPCATSVPALMQQSTDVSVAVQRVVSLLLGRCLLCACPSTYKRLLACPRWSYCWWLRHSMARVSTYNIIIDFSCIPSWLASKSNECTFIAQPAPL